jgi:hypothetical protein
MQPLGLESVGHLLQGEDQEHQLGPLVLHPLAWLEAIQLAQDLEYKNLLNPLQRSQSRDLKAQFLALLNKLP